MNRDAKKPVSSQSLATVNGERAVIDFDSMTYALVGNNALVRETDSGKIFIVPTPIDSAPAYFPIAEGDTITLWYS